MFNFSFDKRTLYIIMAVMIGIVVMQYATDPSRLVTLLISAPAVLIAITFHEYAHGYVAYKLGDDTAKNQGRLSLNPFVMPFIAGVIITPAIPVTHIKINII